ncbi:eukaryotic integral membrane protein-domain-containing protein [Mycena capillaripes]|nr:eukaryotic integral membrane protein-domain-containing protein [Mycena capillaripes]
MAVLPSPLTFIASIPPVTRGFTAATIVVSLFYVWLNWNGPTATPYLTVVPGSSLFYPWTFVTSVLVETSIFELIGSLIFVPPSLRYLERVWGSVETLKFIAISVGFSNIIAFGFNWIEFMFTKNADLFLYGMQYHGQMALQIAILVAFTQLIPEHQVQLFGVFNARVKTLPMAYLTVSTVMTFLGFQCPWIIIQFGWFVSWIYLRFYKKYTGDSNGGAPYGDRSETFSLISWFPPFMHYPLSILANFVHSLATRLHLIPTGSDLESGLYSQLPASQVPGSARAEAERRRAMALKALDQRLANTATPPAANSHSTLPPKPPRAPPPAAAPRSDTAAMPSSPPAAPRAERTKSVGSEVDIGVQQSDSR